MKGWWLRQESVGVQVISYKYCGCRRGEGKKIKQVPTLHLLVGTRELKVGTCVRCLLGRCSECLSKADHALRPQGSIAKQSRGSALPPVLAFSMSGLAQLSKTFVEVFLFFLLPFLGTPVSPGARLLI